MINLKRIAAFCCLLLCSSLQMFAAVTDQSQPTQTLKDALNNASKLFHVSFIYEDELVANKRVNMPADGSYRKVEDYLSAVLKPFNLQFKKLGSTQYAIYSKAPAKSKDNNQTNQVVPAEAVSEEAASSRVPSAVTATTEDTTPQIRMVLGMVTDESLEPVSAATVMVPGTRNMVMTNSKGQFEIKIPVTTKTLQVSCVAYESQQIPVNRTVWYSIALKDKTGYLKPVEVVSTGYVNLPKERATGSFGVITSKELEKVPTANVIQRLEGQVPGLQMQITSGDNSFVYDNNTPAPSSNTRTIGRNDYNFNIRGTSTINSEKSPLIVVDGFPTELDMKTLNPNDIAQITFLRDAAAASIWGARAANGVIVIETKKGRTRMPVVNVSIGFSTQDKPDIGYLKLMNSTQELNYEKELVDKGLVNTSIYNPYTAGVKSYVSDGMDLAFQLKSGRITQAEYDARAAQMGAINNYGQITKYLMQRANSQSYNLSVSGGSDVHTYFLSGSYAKETPSTKGNSGERLTLTANQEFKIIKKITLSTSLKAAFFNYAANGIGLSALSSGGRTFMPYNDIHDKFYYSAGRHYADSLQGLGYQNWGYDYLKELELSSNSSHDNNYSGNLNLNIPIYKGLAFTAAYALERTYYNSRIYFGDSSFNNRDLYNTGTTIVAGKLVKGVPNGGILSVGNSSLNNYSARGQFVYNGTIGKIHELNALAGMEARQTSISQNLYTLWGYNQSTGISQPPAYGVQYNTYNYGSGSLYGAPSQIDKVKRFLSYYGNAAYTLMSRYTLSASVRYDDYNNFGLDRKYRAKPFWSSGISWNINREKFMQPVSWVNNLSLRVTYGINGNINQEIMPFTNISLGAADYQTGLPYAVISSAANPTLRWEKTYVFNAGVDYSLFNGRLGGSIDVYNKKGKDLISTFDVNPTYTGINNSTLSLNGATMSNKGIDIGLNGAIIDSKSFGWNMILNFSYNSNKITDNRFKATSSFFSSLSGSLIKDYPVDAIFAYRSAGLDSTGLMQVYAGDGSKLKANQTITDMKSIKYAGRPSAPYYGSFTNTFRYHQWSLYVLTTYSFGSVFRNPTVSSYPTTRRLSYNVSADIANRWQKPGDEAITNVPGVAGTYAFNSTLRYAYSDLNIQPGDYIRLREISLGYEVPKNIAGKILAKNLHVNAAVRNLGLIWKKNKVGVDPDFLPNLGNVLHLPPTVQYNLMVNVSF
ncbi:TonB-linked outer membrane protein, SusC/RagA family [Chitinophaga sp. CF118]|uniref:SusC/RagA family TonB-linked outer membrane protein n=1 Tax=Chitinophaga sp. CF118 TaxID=1884367 RepID=UPI0008ED4811|nr:SusC/RagA family TonB-linked outer membrane protein [Chitinophaga sp. CF118]SFE41511.1 TonB-linked outer membrane protein, SusC/RagA family [Chitinophaga sp. CF118]